MTSISDTICILCTHKTTFLFDAKDYKSNDAFSLFQCSYCKSAVTFPSFTAKQLTKYYRNYRKSTGTRFFSFIEIVLTYLYKLRVFLAYFNLRPGKILDIGCGRGTELEML